MSLSDFSRPLSLEVQLGNDPSVAQLNQLIDSHNHLSNNHLDLLDPSDLEDLTDEEADDLLHTWELWARENQLEPARVLANGEYWTIWLILAGRGFGKTRTGSETIIKWVTEGSCKRLALIAEDASDARDVMVEGESGIIACSRRGFVPKYEPSKRRLTWPNGAVASLFSAEDYDSLRGPQFDGGWIDELCLEGGTLIQTEFGEIPIEQVKEGDRVWTRAGLKRVLRSWQTSPSADLWGIQGKLAGTAGHPVWTERGFTPLTNLLNTDTIAVWQRKDELCSSTTASAITSGAVGTRAEQENSSAELCGRITSDQSPLGMMSTTRMKIPTITTSITSSFLQGVSTSCDTSLEASQQKTPNGEAITLQFTYGKISNTSSTPASNVEQTSNPDVCLSPSIVTLTVRLEPIVESGRLGRKAAVYNLEVEDQNEYFANGILVHNCKFRYAQEAWDNFMFGLRLGDHPRVIVTTTPRPMRLLKDIILRSDTAITKGNTRENLPNLAPPFVKSVIEKYENTRIGRQELNAEILDDVPGALWNRALIDSTRILPGSALEKIKLPDMARIVIAVDPPKEMGKSGAECGLTASGLDERGHGYLLEDFSMPGPSPEEWGRAAVLAYDKWYADMIVYEANQGGEMVASVLRSAAKLLREEGLRSHDFVPLKAVHATKGKMVRAEPVSQLYEQGKIHHVGAFPELEDQLCLVAGTLIDTARGLIPIEDIVKGDLVLTRKGYAPVTGSGITGYAKDFVELTAAGRSLILTPCHTVYSPKHHQFVPAKLVEAGQLLLVNLSREGGGFQFHGEVDGGGLPKTAVEGTVKRDYSAEQSTKLTMALFRSVILFTTRITTLLTTTIKTWLRSPINNIEKSTEYRELTLSRVNVNLWLRWIDKLKEKLTPSREVVSTAARQFCGTGEGHGNFVKIPAAVNTVSLELQPVYNLHVADPHLHEYFANGILVHNCEYTSEGDMGYSPDRMDSLVWGFTELMVHSISHQGLMDWYRDESKAITDKLSGKKLITHNGPIISIKGPPGINTVYGRDGTRYDMDKNGHFLIREEDLPGLLNAGFRRVFAEGAT